MIRGSTLVSFGGTLALGALMVLPALATVEVQITDSTGTTTYVGTSCGANCSTVVVNAADADFTFDIQVGTSNGPAGPAQLTYEGDVTPAAGTTPESLTISVSDTGFTAPVGGAALVQTANTDTPGAGTFGTYSATGYYGTGADNVFFCEATTGCNASTPTANFPSFSVGNLGQTGSTSVNFATPFSLDEVYTYSFTGAGTAVTTGTLSAVVPEPASMLLFGGVLLITAGAIRRRRKSAERV